MGNNNGNQEGDDNTVKIVNMYGHERRPQHTVHDQESVHAT